MFRKNHLGLEIWVLVCATRSVHRMTTLSCGNSSEGRLGLELLELWNISLFSLQNHGVKKFQPQKNFGTLGPNSGTLGVIRLRITLFHRKKSRSVV